MEHKTQHQKTTAAGSEKAMGKDPNRKDRLKAALKANMAKRKSQTRGRAGSADVDVGSNKNKG